MGIQRKEVGAKMTTLILKTIRKVCNDNNEVLHLTDGRDIILTYGKKDGRSCYVCTFVEETGKRIFSVRSVWSFTILYVILDNLNGATIKTSRTVFTQIGDEVFYIGELVPLKSLPDGAFFVYSPDAESIRIKTPKLSQSHPVYPIFISSENK